MRTSPTFATTHTFCASRNGAYQFKGIFARLTTFRENIISERAIEIQKKIGGNPALFKNMIREKIPYILMYFRIFFAF